MTLQERQDEIVNKFNVLNSQRTEYLQKVEQIQVELVKLQGQAQLLEELIAAAEPAVKRGKAK